MAHVSHVQGPITGPMLHLLNASAAGSCESIEAVCGIHEIAHELTVAPVETIQ